MNKALINASHSILARAAEMWDWGAPEPKNELYTTIQDMLRNTGNIQLMEQVLAHLKKNYSENRFPGFFHWRNAIRDVTPIALETNEKMDLVTIEDRKIRQYEKEAIDKVKSWNHMPEVQKAKEEGWYGCIWNNCAVMPGGIAAYLYALTLRQLKILHPSIDAPLNEPRELIGTDYLTYIRGYKFIQDTLMAQEVQWAVRPQDLEKIKSYCLRAKNFQVSTLNLATMFKPI